MDKQSIFCHKVDGKKGALPVTWALLVTAPGRTSLPGGLQWWEWRTVWHLMQWRVHCCIRPLSCTEVFKWKHWPMCIFTVCERNLAPKWGFEVTWDIALMMMHAAPKVCSGAKSSPHNNPLSLLWTLLLPRVKLSQMEFIPIAQTTFVSQRVFTICTTYYTLSLDPCIGKNSSRTDRHGQYFRNTEVMNPNSSNHRIATIFNN